MLKQKISVEELLFNDEPIVINKKLAKCLGLTEAVIFQQIHYWLKINEKKNHNFKDGRFWTYNSIKNWHQEEFNFLSETTVKRTLQKLEKDGLIDSNCYNKMKGDKTKWYTINYENLLKVCEKKLEDKESLSKLRAEIAKKGHKKKSINTIGSNCTHGGASVQIETTMGSNCTHDEFKLNQPIPEISTKPSTKFSFSSSKDLIDFFEENICKLKKTTLSKFEKYIETESIEFVQAVIEYQASINTRSYAGFDKAIENFRDNNIHTIKELNQFLENFKKSKTKNIELDIINNIELDDSDIDFYEISNEVIDYSNMESANFIKEQLRKELLEIKYKTWIDPLTIVKNERNIIIIAPNDFMRMKIAKDYISNIKKVLIKNKNNLKIKLLIA